MLKRIETPKETSPFNLMQEEYRDRPWALLVGCILFNVVHGKKARPVLEEFLKKWPTPEALLADDQQFFVMSEMTIMFKPLGFQNRRAQRIFGMTWDYQIVRPDVHPEVDVKKLTGVGKYAADSFNIFCRGILVEEVKDKELKNYVKWAKGRGEDRDRRIPEKEFVEGPTHGVRAGLSEAP